MQLKTDGRPQTFPNNLWFYLTINIIGDFVLLLLLSSWRQAPKSLNGADFKTVTNVLWRLILKVNVLNHTVQNRVFSFIPLLEGKLPLKKGNSLISYPVGRRNFEVALWHDRRYIIHKKLLQAGWNTTNAEGCSSRFIRLNHHELRIFFKIPNAVSTAKF